MQNVDFQPRTRLVFAQGCLSRLGKLARELGGTRALVCSDPGVVAVGHYARAAESLQAAGIEVVPFHEVHENPTTDDVQAGLDVALQCRPDLLVGLGGGSSMDCAKGINFRYSCGGRMEDYWGVGRATADMLPMIAVPTTAGTGSEAQSFALISQSDTHIKMACGDSRAACRIALLDPELTLTQPASVTALTGIDAISHALESFVTRKRNPLSICYSRQAWQLLSEGFPRVLEEPLDLEARAQVQLGAYFAGLAIETSMLGAAHALANPLTARFDIAHGQAVGMMLPYVIRFNGQTTARWYGQLWSDLPHSVDGEEPVNALANFVSELLVKANLRTELSACGVDPTALDELAKNAAEQWTGSFNPVPLTPEILASLYRQAF